MRNSHVRNVARRDPAAGVDEHGQIEPTAVDGEVLVPAEALELDRLPVQEQAIAAHLDGTDADVERVGIAN